MAQHVPDNQQRDEEELLQHPGDSERSAIADSPRETQLADPEMDGHQLRARQVLRDAWRLAHGLQAELIAISIQPPDSL
jgi:hypothetical protein